MANMNEQTPQAGSGSSAAIADADPRASPPVRGRDRTDQATYQFLNQDPISGGAFTLGIVFLGVSIIFSLVLVLNHLSDLELPGCGPGSGCAEAAASVWGKILLGKFEFPVSFVGFAYFTGALVAWLMSKHGTTPLFRTVVRLGAVVSLFFVIIMVSKWGQYACKYCLAAHAGNFCFWILMERAKKAREIGVRPALVLTCVFLAVCGITGAAKWQRAANVRAEQNKLADEARDEIIAKSQEDAMRAVVTNPPEHDGPGFTGRYLFGPAEAPIRLVMLTDYQCPDCRAVEMKAREILERRDDVSLSIKHFPMDQSCNPDIFRTLHGKACWAARAAEAAGILRGDDGFWEMHNWLFDRRADFTPETLTQALQDFGYDVEEFLEVMKGATTLELVQQDIREGQDLGLRFTPMIFINGRQLRGVYEMNADKLVQAVEKLAATNPPPMSAVADQPPMAVEKYIGDWEEQPRKILPPDGRPWARGPETARIQIVVWGDFQEQSTVELDRAVVKWLKDKPEARYSFRHFPFHQECNPVLTPPTRHPFACMASRAAEAAGQLGGLDGYWRMHDWLMDNHQHVNDQTLRQAALDLGFDARVFFATMPTEEITRAIEEDCRAAKRTKETQQSLLWRGAIPTIFINGKIAPWWKVKDDIVIDKILDAAYQPVQGE